MLILTNAKATMVVSPITRESDTGGRAQLEEQELLNSGIHRRSKTLTNCMGLSPHSSSSRHSLRHDLQ